MGRFHDADGGAGAAGAAGNASDGADDGQTVELLPIHTRLALGVASSCAITQNGAVICWGDNSVGQLGVGAETPAQSTEPLSVVGLGSGARALFGGAVAQCAVEHDGHVVCWGDSAFGSFEGMPVHAISYSPLEAPGLSSVNSLGVGTYFTCALTAFGDVKCYGLNGAGQLGNGSLADSYVPATVQALPPSRQLSASQSGFFACAASVAGTVYCWGSNSHGQLGNGSTQDAYEARAVDGLDGVTEVRAGREHACAISAGAVYCWGDNAFGQLGTPGAGSTTPVAVGGLPEVVALAAGVHHTCALGSDGSVHCWGSAPSGSSPSGPAVVASDAVEIAAGGDHTCALTSAGILRCWGNGQSGQLGPFGGSGAPL